MAIGVEDKAQFLLETGADVTLITFCELQGSVEVDVECKYSGGLHTPDVSNSHPKCTISLWDSTTPFVLL